MRSSSILQMPLHPQALEHGDLEAPHPRRGHVHMALVRLHQGMVGEFERRGHRQPKSEGFDNHVGFMGDLE